MTRFLDFDLIENIMPDDSSRLFLLGGEEEFDNVESCMLLQSDGHDDISSDALQMSLLLHKFEVSLLSINIVLSCCADEVFEDNDERLDVVVRRSLYRGSNDATSTISSSCTPVSLDAEAFVNIILLNKCNEE